MATVVKNLVTEGLRGRVGNVIFRIRNGKTMLYPYTKGKAPLSKKQVEAQLKFAVAVRLAREALANEPDRKKFKKMAKSKGNESAYSAAVAYFMLKK